MRVLTINELMRLTRTELCGLAFKFKTKIATLPPHTPERAAAQINLRNIRHVLARRDFSP